MPATIKCTGLFVLTALLFIMNVRAQKAEDTYRRPLADVLTRVEQTFGVKLRYDDRDVKGRDVNYATWRFTTDVKTTLDNILKPLNLSYQAKGKGIYEIGPYEYYRRTEEEGKKHLDELMKAYPDATAFDKRKKELRACILNALGITDFENRTALNPVYRPAVTMNGYSVQNVAFESIPGYFVTGTLYRPTDVKGPLAVIICPHGHFFNEKNPSISADSGRYRADMQYRCAGLAKMGSIVFSYDMYSWGESANQTGNFSYHETGFSEAIQTWNSIRALDFLLSLPGADKTRVGVTGASGGGTQTILVSALDNRVTASVPVVMVSSSFFGGCPCESGLPIHDVCNRHKTNNAEIAAMVAPRPMLLISDGSDWTTSVPGTDYPYLKKLYGFYGKTANVESVYLPNDKHDYGITKRTPMYHFFAKVFGLNLRAITGKDGKIDESSITVQTNNDLHVFNMDFPLPSNALRSHEEIVKAFRTVQRSR